ncbi:hypothetical protein Tco_0921736 [Tanacetum coccineum]
MDCGTISAFSGCCMVITIIVLSCLYTCPNHPKLTIEDFSVPSLNITPNHIPEDIYFDLKLRNMNKAVGLYYDDPFSLAITYSSLDQPYQKYVWESTVPAFYQGNGKTKHIKSLMSNNRQLPSTALVDEEDTPQMVENGLDMLAPSMLPSYEDNGDTKHVRSLLREYIQLPSTSSGEIEKANPVEVVSFRINLIANYRFRLWWDSSKHHCEVGAEVMVNANTGERISEGSIKLVKSKAAAAGPVLLMVLFTSILLMSI